MVKRKLETIKIESTIFLYSVLIFSIINSQISFDRDKAFMVPAIISASLIFFWGIILTVGMFQVFSPNFDLGKSLNSFLIALVSIAIANNAFGFMTALSGTPTSAGDIRGDFGNYIKLAEKAKEYFWPGNTYPPLYFFVIGRISEFTGIDVILLFKPVDIVICFMLPIAIFSTWKLIISKNLALVVTLINLMFFNMTWKNIGNLLFLPIIIALILRTRNIVEPKRNDNKLIISNILCGFGLGIISLIYFGSLYWSLFSIAIVIFSTLLSTKRNIYCKTAVDYLFGFGIVVIPTIARDFFEVGILEILIFLGFIPFFYYIRAKLSVIIYFIITIVSLSMIYAFIKLETFDEFIYNSIDTLNPAWTLFSSLDLASFIVISVLILIILVSNYDPISSTILIVIFINILGTAVQKYYLVVNAYKTGYVEFFPRADFQLFYNSVLLISLIILLSIKDNKYINDFFEVINLQNFEMKVKAILVAFICSSYVFYQLSNRIDIYLSNNEMTSPYIQALISCQSSIDDPMLAKTFEENPRWKITLEKNCPQK